MNAVATKPAVRKTSAPATQADPVATIDAWRADVYAAAPQLVACLRIMEPMFRRGSVQHRLLASGIRGVELLQDNLGSLPKAEARSRILELDAIASGVWEHESWHVGRFATYDISSITETLLDGPLASDDDDDEAPWRSVSGWRETVYDFIRAAEENVTQVITHFTLPEEVHDALRVAFMDSPHDLLVDGDIETVQEHVRHARSLLVCIASSPLMPQPIFGGAMRPIIEAYDKAKAITDRALASADYERMPAADIDLPGQA